MRITSTTRCLYRRCFSRLDVCMHIHAYALPDNAITALWKIELCLCESSEAITRGNTRGCLCASRRYNHRRSFVTLLTGCVSASGRSYVDVSSRPRNFVIILGSFILGYLAENCRNPPRSWRRIASRRRRMWRDT